MTARLGGYVGNGSVLEINFSDGYIRTLFPDGAVCIGSHLGNDPAKYAATARHLGYGDDVRRMAVENDALHVFLCERAGLPFSPTLWGTAHRRWFWLWEREEGAVFALQHLLHSDEAALTGVECADLGAYAWWTRPRTTLGALAAEARTWLAALETGPAS